MKDNLIEFLKYGVVGIIATVADVGLFTLCVKVVGLHYFIAIPIGFIAGLGVNYYLSKRFVFTHSKTSGLVSFLVFAIIGVIGLGLNYLIVWIGVDVLSGVWVAMNLVAYKELASKVVSTGIVFIWNYLARKLLVFNKMEEK